VLLDEVGMIRFTNAAARDLFSKAPRRKVKTAVRLHAGRVYRRDERA
jgi:hypothetical protein